MTATTVDYIERKAYDVAVRDYCLPERETKKIAMPELFDMIAGSETGAIIATSLVIPNKDVAEAKAGQKNQYFASESMKWFQDNTDTLYHNSEKYLTFGRVLGFILSVLIGWAVYYHTDKSFEAADFEEIVIDMRWLLKVEKKIAKGKPFDRDDVKLKIEQITFEINSQTSSEF